MVHRPNSVTPTVEVIGRRNGVTTAGPIGVTIGVTIGAAILAMASAGTLATPDGPGTGTAMPGREMHGNDRMRS